MFFSQRYGYKSVRDTIQIEDIDDDLRNKIWNVIHLVLWEEMNNNYNYISYMPEEWKNMITRLWHSFYKDTLDDLNDRWGSTLSGIKRWYFDEAAWYEIYDFLEFLINNMPERKKEAFIMLCNTALEEEISGYRFVDKQITPITDKEEIQAIEDAISDKTPCKGTRTHLQNALNKLSDRKNPDYRNSIKESISAVEAMANAVTGQNNASLGKALDIIESKGKVEVHKALKAGYDKIYGYTSDAGGIRHAILDESNLCFEDALYMLVSCSAFINYLVAKAQKAGIELKK